VGHTPMGKEFLGSGKGGFSDLPSSFGGSGKSTHMGFSGSGKGHGPNGDHFAVPMGSHGSHHHSGKGGNSRGPSYDTQDSGSLMRRMSDDGMSHHLGGHASHSDTSMMSMEASVDRKRRSRDGNWDGPGSGSVAPEEKKEAKRRNSHHVGGDGDGETKKLSLDGGAM
jgi:hypothetical protein